MVDADRVIRKRRIEIVSVQQSAVRHDSVVIAVAHDHLAFRNAALRRELLELGDDAWNVLPRTGRWRV